MLLAYVHHVIMHKLLSIQQKNCGTRMTISNDNFARTNVFINPNLTKAESKAQFEIRQRRRQTYEAHKHVTNKQECVHTTPTAQQFVSLPEQLPSTPSS